MSAIRYRVKHAKTGQFWTGRLSGQTPLYNSTGKSWSSMTSLENAVGKAIVKINNTEHFKNWSVEGFQLVTQVRQLDYDSDTLIRRNTIKLHAFRYLWSSTISTMHGRLIRQYLEKAVKNGDIEKVSYILIVKSESTHYISNEEILAAREQLRGIGVKTRSFREHYGVFAMYDRDQAIRAKMTLDLGCFMDLDDIRSSIL